MSGYAIYVFSSWAIVCVAIGWRIVHDTRRLRTLQREVNHDT
jgi:heme exporter protein CcmD